MANRKTELALRYFAGEKRRPEPSVTIITILLRKGLLKRPYRNSLYTCTTREGYAWLAENILGKCAWNDGCTQMLAPLVIDPYEEEIHDEIKFCHLCDEHLRDRKESI